jgi:hypothetical protein
MEEMDVQSVDLGAILGEGVEHRFAPSPVVFGLPILYETFEATKLYPLREVLNCLMLLPASRCKPSLKIIQLLFWRIDRKGYYIRQAATSRTRHLFFSTAVADPIVVDSYPDPYWRILRHPYHRHLSSTVSSLTERLFMGFKGGSFPFFLLVAAACA